MTITLQAVIDKARIPLNDADKDRYPDAELLGYANDGLLVLRNKRPDLFVGAFSTPWANKALTDAFPLDDQLVVPMCDYIAFRAESKNDESILEQRAGAFFSLFKEQT